MSKIHSNQRIWKRKIGNEILKNTKAFISCSQAINDVYENLKDYNPTKKKRGKC